MVAECDALIGCDGVKSEVRRLFYDQKPQFTGWIAYRGCVEVAQPWDGKTMVILGRLQDAVPTSPPPPPIPTTTMPLKADDPLLSA